MTFTGKIYQFVLLFFVFHSCISQESKPITEEINKEEVEIVSQTPKNELKLLFIGDFMGHMDQINAAFNKDTKTYDYDDCFAPVKPLLSDADVTIGNIEVTLGIKPYSGYPQFSSPPSYASAIKNAGVDVLTTANNHSCDKGKRGLERTINILDSLAIGHTGTFINKEQKDASPAYIIDQNGIRLAIINFTYGTNEIPPTHPNIVNYLDKETVKNDIEAAKKMNPDEIIAFVHWGYQYKDLPNNDQKEMFDFFKENGVNIVIGAHPHVLQPMHWKKSTETTQESLVVYSLGNFVSHQRTFPRDGGAVFELTLQKNEEGISIKDANYTLTWVHEPVIEGKKHYYILPVKEYENRPEYFTLKKDYDKMMRFVKHARSLLGRENQNISEK